MEGKPISYLALGDSYTIGEGVQLLESFPYQTVSQLRRSGFPMLAPEIIAQTGWTSFELEEALADWPLLPKYDMVSLLIGVNNQYRGLSHFDFKVDLARLAEKALQLTNHKAYHVFLLSIPDWGQTPFANHHDRERISHEIDLYNEVVQNMAITHGMNYLDITRHSRMPDADESRLTNDRLHPSERVYAYWAEQLSQQIESVFLAKLQS